MKISDRDDAAKPCWAINGRFLTQRSTGVQRYAQEIVRALDDILATNPDYARRLKIKLVVPPALEKKPELSAIDVFQTRVGSGHFWDQFALPFHEGAGILSLGNFGPALARNQILCIHDASTFIEPESYSTLFGLVYRAGLPLLGKRARRIATVSRFSADMLVQYGVCCRDKIFIAPNGHEHALRWDAAKAQVPILEGLKRQYVLLLGSAAKHKNIDVILHQAEGLGAAGIDIVVAGGTASIFSAQQSMMSGSNGRPGLRRRGPAGALRARHMSGVPIEDGRIWHSTIGSNGQRLSCYFVKCSKSVGGRGRRGDIRGPGGRRLLERGDNWPIEE